MKNKWIIVLLLVTSAFTLIGIGYIMNCNSGYLLESDESVLESIAELHQTTKDDIKIIKKYQYSHNGTHLYMVASETKEKYFFDILEEKEGNRYKLFYQQYSLLSESRFLVIRDYKHGLLIAHGENKDQKIKSIHTISNTTVSEISYISEKDSYIITCFENQNDQLLSIYPADQEGIAIENLTMSEDAIQ